MDIQKQIAMQAVMKAHKRNGTTPPPELLAATAPPIKKVPVSTGADPKQSSQAKNAAAAAIAARMGGGSRAPPSTAAGGGGAAVSDETLEKFRKMVKMGVPPPAIRGKMAAEGIPASVIEDVLSGGGGGGGSSAASRPTAASSSSAARGSAPSLSPDDEQIAAQYRKMVKIGLPEGSIIHKMTSDGVPKHIQDAVLAGENTAASVAAAPPSSGGGGGGPPSRLSAEEEVIAAPYRRMVKMSLPDGAILHKMAMDGVTQNIQDSVMAREVPSAAVDTPTSGGGLGIGASAFAAGAASLKRAAPQKSKSSPGQWSSTSMGGSPLAMAAAAAAAMRGTGPKKMRDVPQSSIPQRSVSVSGAEAMAQAAAAVAARRASRLDPAALKQFESKPIPHKVNAEPKPMVVLKPRMSMPSSGPWPTRTSLSTPPSTTAVPVSQQRFKATSPSASSASQTRPESTTRQTPVGSSAPSPAQRFSATPSARTFTPQKPTPASVSKGRASISVIPVHKPTPAVQKPTPTVQKPTPAVQKPTPTAQKPTPTVQKPTPTAQKPTPAVATAPKPTPVADTSRPQTTATTPAPKPTPDLGKSPAAISTHEPATARGPAEVVPKLDPDEEEVADHYRGLFREFGQSLELVKQEMIDDGAPANIQDAVIATFATASASNGVSKADGPKDNNPSLTPASRALQPTATTPSPTPTPATILTQEHAAARDPVVVVSKLDPDEEEVADHYRGLIREHGQSLELVKQEMIDDGAPANIQDAVIATFSSPSVSNVLSKADGPKDNNRSPTPASQVSHPAVTTPAPKPPPEVEKPPADHHPGLVREYGQSPEQMKQVMINDGAPANIQDAVIATTASAPDSNVVSKADEQEDVPDAADVPDEEVDKEIHALEAEVAEHYRTLVRTGQSLELVIQEMIADGAPQSIQDAVVSSFVQANVPVPLASKSVESSSIADAEPNDVYVTAPARVAYRPESAVPQDSGKVLLEEPKMERKVERKEEPKVIRKEEPTKKVVPTTTPTVADKGKKKTRKKTAKGTTILDDGAEQHCACTIM